MINLLSEAGAGAANTLINVTGVDFTQVLNEMVALLPTMLPVAISVIAFRKGINFILGFVRGA